MVKKAIWFKLSDWLSIWLGVITVSFRNDIEQWHLWREGMFVMLIHIDRTNCFCFFLLHVLNDIYLDIFRRLKRVNYILQFNYGACSKFYLTAQGSSSCTFFPNKYLMEIRTITRIFSSIRLYMVAIPFFGHIVSKE